MTEYTTSRPIFNVKIQDGGDRHAAQDSLKAAFHDTDIDTDTDSPDTPTSLRPTRAISSQGSLRGFRFRCRGMRA